MKLQLYIMDKLDEKATTDVDAWIETLKGLKCIDEKKAKQLCNMVIRFI